MKKISKNLLLMIVAFVMFLAPTNIIKGDSSNEIIILHTNDMHGQMDPGVKELAYLKAYKEHVGAIALFDAGDASQGLPLNNITKGKVMGDIMMKIGYDAMTLGNHEFDYGRAEVLGTAEGFFTTFDRNLVVATNVYFTSDSDAGAPGEPVFEESLKFEKDGVKFSVFGAATPETYVKADPRHSKGIEFREPIAAVLTEIVKDDYKDSDVFVVLAHLGSDLETEVNWRGTTLAQQLSETAALAGKQVIVIDGHSHTEYPNGLKFGDNVLYGQTGGALGTVGQMHINLDDISQSYAKTVFMRDGYNLHPNMDALEPNTEIVNI